MNRVRIDHRAQQVLPDAIQTVGLRGLAMSTGQLRHLLFGLLLGDESRGAVMLELARQAVDAIQQQGLAYFDGATRSRGVLSGDAPTHYEAWQHLSPDAERGRVAGCGEWMDAAHDGLAPGRWHRLETAWRERVYLTHEIGRNAWLAVLPTARLVVYGWRDRG